MKFEHFALNLKQPKAVAEWYAENCGMKIVIGKNEAPYAHFLADSTGRMVWEIYDNEAVAAVPDYQRMHHLTYHFAFSVDDLDSEVERLKAAGSSYIEEVTAPDGSRLAMLRDPFGMPLQLCLRATPFD